MEGEGDRWTVLGSVAVVPLARGGLRKLGVTVIRMRGDYLPVESPGDVRYFTVLCVLNLLFGVRQQTRYKYPFTLIAEF